MKSQTSETNIFKKVGAVSASFLLAAGLSVPVSISTSLFGNETAAYAEPSAQEQAQEALTKLNTLEAQMGEAENVYNQAVIDKQNAQQKVDEAQGRIDECNQKMKEVQEKLAPRVKSMYRSGSSSMLDLILGSTTFTEFATNWGLLESLNQKDAELISESKALRQEIGEQKATLEEQKKVAEDKEAEAAETYQKAQELVTSQQSIYDGLSADAQEELNAARDAQNFTEAQTPANAGGNTNNNGGGNNNNNGGGTSYEPSNNVDPGSVLGRAYAQLGKPYVWGAYGPDAFDCSGFVGYCLTGSYSRWATTYTFMGYPQVSNPQAGDLCVNGGHVAIYLGGGQIIHAANPQAGVVITSTSWMGGDFIYVRP